MISDVKCVVIGSYDPKRRKGGEKAVEERCIIKNIWKKGNGKEKNKWRKEE